MVFFLTLNILSHLRDLRLGHRVRVIIILPTKLSLEPSLLIDPMSRLAFYEHHNLRNVLFSPERKQDMEVFRPTADGVEEDLFGPAIFLDVGVQFRPCGNIEKRFSIVSAKNDVYPNADEGHRVLG
jgi:hypothetical protein